MDKNSLNSESLKENPVFQRSPLKEKKIFTSAVSTNIVNLEEANEVSNSSKLNVIFVGNQNSELVRKILKFDTTDPNSKQLERSKHPKNLPKNIFGKSIHTNKENINSHNSRLTRLDSMLPTISKRIIYSVSDMSYNVLMKKVHTDFLYFQELCRIGNIKNDWSTLHHKTPRFFSNGLKKETNRFSEKLNPPNAHSKVAKFIKSVHSNIRAEHLNPVNIMNYNFSESHSSQCSGKISNGVSEKFNAHSIVKNEASAVNNVESTIILDNKNLNVDNPYLKSMANYSQCSLEYPEKKKNKLSEEVNKSSNNSVVIKDTSFANRRDFRMNPDKESSTTRHFDSGKNGSKYFQHSIEGKRYDCSQESTKSDAYSIVTIKVSNAFKPDMTLDLDCENSNIASEKDSKSLGSSKQQTEPLDLSVQKPQNDFNFTELKSIHKSPSPSEDVLSLNSSTTGKNPSNISVDEQGIILDSMGPGNKSQVNLITVNELKASILETKGKGKTYLQREPMNDLSKPSVQLSNYVYIPSILTSEVNNLRSTISPETKSSNTVEESVSPGVEESVSPGVEESVSPGVEESVSPGVEESVSPGVEESVSPGVEESVSPNVEESVSPNVEESVSPNVEESVSPNVEESVSPNVEESVSPNVEESVPPNVEESVSPNVPATSSNINGTEAITALKTEVKSDEKTLPDLKKESPASSHNATSNIDSSLLSKDSARELCFDFLHFTTKWNTHQIKLKQKLTRNQSGMEALIKDTENICRKMENVSASTSQESNEIKKSFSQLQYLIGCVTSSKLTPFFKKASEMQKDFQSLHTCMEQYNNGAERRLVRIFNVICEGSDRV
ncbi:hypothetical protein TNCV_1756261 [Trichonephila clavipes]|nr:hypothetical protein TNCV_1756261 [Trichonephila clavipes]